jgi:hypothetical protein
MPVTDQLSDAKRNLLGKYLAGNAAFPRACTILRRHEGALAPLSLSQEELWRREQQAPGIPPLYNECVAVRMRGPLEIPVLERALTEIIQRHEIWRTTFETRAGAPVQVAHAVTPVRLPIADVRSVPAATREGEAIRLMNAETRRPFLLDKEPPLRPILVRMADSEHWLFLIAHLIVLDGPSAYQIFPLELAEVYKAFTTGRAPNLPELPVQCADFACWQRESLDIETGKQVAYWRGQLSSNDSPSQWPIDKPKPSSRGYRGIIRPFELSTDTSQGLRDFSHRENTTLFSTLLAGFAALLHRYSRQERIFLGTLSPSGRKRSEVLNLLGYFLNPVTLKFDFASDPTFDELLIQARKVMAGAIGNDDVPIEHIARQLKPGDSSPSPFFRAAISLQPFTPNLDLGWSVTSMDVDSGGSPWELYLAFIDRPQGMIGRAQFDPDIFDEDSIGQIVKDLDKLLAELTANPQLRFCSNFARPLGTA